MASPHISTFDRCDSNKYKAWLKIISNDCLLRKYQSVQDKHCKVLLALIGNAVLAVFTVPTTLGIAAVWHIAVHVAAQVKFANYTSQLQSCKAVLKQRSLKF
jgi:hypothetical protein